MTITKKSNNGRKYGLGSVCASRNGGGTEKRKARGLINRANRRTSQVIYRERTKNIGGGFTQIVHTVN